MLRVDLLSYDDPYKDEPEINVWFTYRKGDKAVEIHSREENLVLVEHTKKNGIFGRKMKRFLLTDKEKFLEELIYAFSGSYLRATDVYEI